MSVAVGFGIRDLPQLPLRNLSQAFGSSLNSEKVSFEFQQHHSRYTPCSYQNANPKTCLASFFTTCCTWLRPESSESQSVITVMTFPLTPAVPSESCVALRRAGREGERRPQFEPVGSSPPSVKVAWPEKRGKLVARFELDFQEDAKRLLALEPN